MMISDGFGATSVGFARTVAGRALHLDHYLVGNVRTASSNSLVTDSAAGATAYACGKHTYNEGIGIDADGVACGTVLEAAALKGMRTGLVTTTRVTDATPAAFSSHSLTRRKEEFIAQQQLDLLGGIPKHIDLLMGGGRLYFANRTDGLDLMKYAQEQGYQVITTKAEMENVKTADKLLALFTEGNMPFELDRASPPLSDMYPSLVEMTRKALQLISQNNQNGFFLMVEGALIDIAGHNNDPASHVGEILQYDEAFSLVLEFAEADGNTIVISTSDHETGGLTLGLQTNFAPNSEALYAYYPNIALAAKTSTDVMARQIIGGEDLQAVLAASANITNLTENELQYIQQFVNASSKVYDLSGRIGKVISTRSLLGWSTRGHTGADVNLFGYNIGNELGNMENIDVAGIIAQWLDLDLESVTQRLSNFSANANEHRTGSRFTRSSSH